MHTIQFDTQTEQALNHLAAMTGKDSDQIIMEAVNEFIAEHADMGAADAAYARYLAGQEKTLTLDELEQSLGLDS